MPRRATSSIDGSLWLPSIHSKDTFAEGNARRRVGKPTTLRLLAGTHRMHLQSMPHKARFCATIRSVKITEFRRHLAEYGATLSPNGKVGRHNFASALHY